MLGKGKGNIKSSLQKPAHIKIRRMESLLIQHKTMLTLFIGMLAFKISADAGLYWLATQDPVSYPFAFSVVKYLIGTAGCCIMFFSIRHDRHCASSFFLYFLFLFQMVPITSVYALLNKSTLFYLVLTISFILCSALVGNTKSKQTVKRSMLVSNATTTGLIGIVLIIVALIYMRYGLPSLSALDIYSVYELRGSGAFSLGRYENYLFTWTTAVIVPGVIAWSIVKRKYLLTCVSGAIMLALYLYSGNKTFLFSIPLVVLCTFWSRRKNFYRELFTVGCFGFSVFVALLFISPTFRDIIEKVFSLLVRRVMFVPANNKFHYFDYFSDNPKMGLGGIFPQWIIDIPNYYENIPYTYEISDIYYGQPQMNSNTGFLAEGFMRFGHIGTVGIMLLFAWILKQIDLFQERAGYSLTIGIFIYQIYSLADAHLIDSLILGPWMILLIILLLFNVRTEKKGIKLNQKRFRFIW